MYKFIAICFILVGCSFSWQFGKDTEWTPEFTDAAIVALEERELNTDELLALMTPTIVEYAPMFQWSPEGHKLEFDDYDEYNPERYYGFCCRDGTPTVYLARIQSYSRSSYAYLVAITVLHEVGHFWGLPHDNSDPANLMNSRISQGVKHRWSEKSLARLIKRGIFVGD